MVRNPSSSPISRARLSGPRPKARCMYRSWTSRGAPTPPANARTPSHGSGSSRAEGKVSVNGKPLDVLFRAPGAER